MAPRFDIVVHGATGYMGRLVIRALLRDSDGLSWAIAGRNEAKLRATKQALTQFADVDAAALEAVPILVADSMNEAQIVAMVQQTKVVLSLVGPYKLYGDALVKACAEHGVHYCDLTGESYWVREVIDKYEGIAKTTGAKIVPCCGFDSIPSDLTTFLLADAVRKHKNSGTSKVGLFFTGMRGGVGGGTIASGIVMMDVATKAQMKDMNHPFHLTDDATMEEKEAQGLVKRNSEASSVLIRKEPDLNLWSSMFIMTMCNQAVVHRSNYLLGNQYGENFVYRERNAIGGFFGTLLGTVAQIFAGLLLALKPTRKLIARLVTQPGDGPSEETQRSGYVNISAFAYDDQGKLAAKAKVSCDGDPGYYITSKMIVESAKCLATDETNEVTKKGGFFTPASAFGHYLRDRFERKNIFKFDLENVQMGRVSW